MIFLDVKDLLHIAQRTLGQVELRDLGLLEAAAARPRASAFGEDAYPALHTKAAAVLHSIACNHALVDGNKRLALAAVLVFLEINGQHVILSNDEAYDLVYGVASGQITDVDVIATRLVEGTEPA